MIAIAGDEKVTVLWSRDGSLRRAIDPGPGNYSWKRGLAFSPDSQWLAFGTWEDEVRLLRRRLEILRLLGSREARREESGADRKENASRAARHLDSIMPCPASRSIRP